MKKQSSTKMMRPIAYRAALGITKSVEHRQRHEGLLPPTVLVSARAAALPAHDARHADCFIH